MTQKFLEVTLEAYRREMGDEFGQRVPGSFCDEPNWKPGGGLPWTDDLPQVFQKRWGYDLPPHLPSLAAARGRLAASAAQLLSRCSIELFIERWSKPYHDYCEKHGLEWTGHYWDHEWPNCQAVPDNMAMYAWHQRPAIDCLMNQYKEDVHAQFGNVRMVRELASVANSSGQRRTLCETYGAGGWDLRFEDMKRIGDWLMALGVNTIDEHLSYITIRGARKHDHPQSFSYHEPWWSDYHVMAQYFARLSLALSQGTADNHILVIEPTTSAWMYQFANEPAQREHLNQLGETFQAFLLRLENAWIEYDVGSEDIIARHGRVRPAGPENGGHAQFCIGQGRYDFVVLPPGTENLNSRTLALLKEFSKTGRVFSCGPPPGRVDGQESGAATELAAAAGWLQMPASTAGERGDISNLAALLGTKRQRRDYFRLEHNLAKPVFHQRRKLDRGQLLFIANTSADHFADGVVFCSKEAGIRSAEWWEPESGQMRQYPLLPDPNLPGKPRDTSVAVHLPPCGSRLLLFSPDAASACVATSGQPFRSSPGWRHGTRTGHRLQRRGVCPPPGAQRVAAGLCRYLVQGRDNPRLPLLPRRPDRLHAQRHEARSVG